MDPIIDTLIVEEHRIEHIARHQVSIEEVQEGVSGDYVFIQGHHERWLLIGKTRRGRFLVMSEVTIVIDREAGVLVTEVSQKLPGSFFAELTRLIGSARSVGVQDQQKCCPSQERPSMHRRTLPTCELRATSTIPLSKGPGRRTSVWLSGCNLQCKGCWVPVLHSAVTGSLIDVGSLADLLLDPRHKRDGLSILGGEPFFHAEGLLALVRALRQRGCPHIVVYTGHTYEGLLARALQQPAAILDDIGVPMDSPYVKALGNSAGPWTGSGNQPVIHVMATRREGKVVTCAQ